MYKVTMKVTHVMCAGEYAKYLEPYTDTVYIDVPQSESMLAKRIAKTMIQDKGELSTPVSAEWIDAEPDYVVADEPGQRLRIKE